MNRRIRYVLCHLHHWHLLMLDWYREGMNGNKPSMPAEGYTWKTTPTLNLWLFESYQNTSLEESKYLVKKGFYNLQKLIVSHSNEELFTKKTLLLDGNNLAWILSNFGYIETLWVGLQLDQKRNENLLIKSQMPYRVSFSLQLS